MKRFSIYIPLLLCLMAACKDTPKLGTSKQEEAAPVSNTIAAGTVIAADSMAVAEDALNNSYFGVQLLATEYTPNYGTYEVIAHWGHNLAKSEFSMPKGGEDIVPVLRKAKTGYCYDIGFYYKDEPEFYEYYRVSADGQGDLKFQYLRAYSFQ